MNGPANSNPTLLRRSPSGRIVTSSSTSPLSPKSGNRKGSGMNPLEIAAPTLVVVTNPTGSASAFPNTNHSTAPCTRIKRFQLCLWILLIVAFLHLFTRPSVETVPPEHFEPKKGGKVKSSKGSHKGTTRNSTRSTPAPPTAPPSASSSSSSSLSSNEESIKNDSTGAVDDKEGLPKKSKSTSTPTIAPGEDEAPPPSKAPKSQPSRTPPDADGTKPIKPRRTPRPSSPIVHDKSKEPQSPPPATLKHMPQLEDGPSAYTILPAKTDSTALHNNPKAVAYVEKHCDLTHVKELYPSHADDVWQQRAPYVIIAGVWNAGVEAMRTALLQHPQIDAAKTNGFFLPKQFYRYFTTTKGGNGGNASGMATTGNSTSAEWANTDIMNVKVFAARKRMYAQAYSPSTLRDREEDNATRGDAARRDDAVPSKAQHVAMDFSPGLVFYAHTTAHSILCVSPWAKVVVLVRNPVDRVYQQWVYSQTKLGLTLSLEDWMAQEMKLFQSTGLVPMSTAPNAVSATGDVPASQQQMTATSEKEAWNKYQSVRNVAGAIGRSLYVLQLQEWIDAYHEAGKVPAEEMIILASEDVEEYPIQKYNQLIDFLGLMPLTTTTTTLTGSRSVNMSGSSSSHGTLPAVLNLGGKPSPPKGMAPMKEETRKMLQRFFRPYNQRLVKLLTSNGFEGDWDHLWQ